MTRGARSFATLLIAAPLLSAPPASRVLGIILVNTRAEADALRARITAGESFERLAAKHSTDPSAPLGGYLGRTAVADLLPEIQEALKTAADESVSGVISVGPGFMIVRTYRRERVPVPGTRRSPAQLVAYVSGFDESLHFISRYPKPENFHLNLQAICDAKLAAIDDAVRETQARVARATSPRDQLQLHHTLAQLNSYQGKIPDAIAHFDRAFQIANEAAFAELIQPLREKLAIAYLRKGELDNCLSNHNARSCIFPFSPEARHKMREGSTQARVLFADYLRNQPDDAEVRWLLSLAQFTLGEPGKDATASHLLDPWRSGGRTREFIDVAHSSGLHRMNNAGGTVLDDFDGDGRPDIAISVVNACEPMGFYRNSGEGSFEERTRQAGLGGQLGGININHADFNNDGWPDIFVMRGGWEFPMRNSLLRNDAGRGFTDVTAPAGLATPAYPTPTSAWADYDNDGHVDLFVGNENGPAQLFRNKGDGTFTDVAAAAGVNRVAFTKGATWGDYDNDGFPDLYVSNYEQENFLYRNNRDGTFEEIAKVLGVEGPLASFPTWFFDYDNDGCLDLFVSSYVQSVAEFAAEYLKLPTRSETMRLYRNNCRGGFDDVSEEMGLKLTSMAMGANFGDIDNDGYLDFYLGTGSPSYGALIPNRLFRNDAGARFVDDTAATGTGHLQKGHGIAFGDYDADGDQDIFLHTGGAVPGDTYSNVLFRNPGNTNRAVRIKLAGVKTNRSAIGVRIKATITEPGWPTRAIHRVVSSGGSFGSSSFEQHIGIGKAGRIDSLEIWWPTSRTRQTFSDIPAGSVVEIRETDRAMRRRGQ